MTTAQVLIDGAFEEIGVKAAESPLTDAMAQKGLRKLNNILNEWNATGILVGIEPVYDLSTDLLEPDYATGAIEAQVGVRLAGQFGQQVSQSLAVQATAGYNTLIATAPPLKVAYPSTLPKGSGNRRYYENYYDFFPEQDERNF